MPVFGDGALELAYNPAEPRDPRTGRWYHGTNEVFSPGDLIEPGHAPSYNPFGDIQPRPHVYLTSSTQIAWNEGTRKHIYEVEPTGPVLRDPEYRDWKNRYMMSKHPLRVVREVYVNPDTGIIEASNSCSVCGCSH